MGSRPMLDVNLLRERPEVIRENLVKRGDTARLPVLEDAVRWDREWRARPGGGGGPPPPPNRGPARRREGQEAGRAPPAPGPEAPGRPPPRRDPCAPGSELPKRL